MTQVTRLNRPACCDPDDRSGLLQDPCDPEDVAGPPFTGLFDVKGFSGDHFRGAPGSQYLDYLRMALCWSCIRNPAQRIR